MRARSKQFLKDLIDTMSPSGFEGEASRVWRDYVSTFADEVRVDVHGNTIAVVNPGGKPVLMLAGHIDEIGLMVRHVDENGYLYFGPIGGWDAQILQGQRVWVQGKNGERILGVVGKKPIHLLEPKEREQVPKLHDLWIDIGAKDKDDALKRVDIGAPAVVALGMEDLGNGILVGRGFDDRVGAFVVAEALRLAKQKKLQAAVYAVATVQEEIGLRGARTSAFGINPDVGIAVDVTFSTDYPGVDKRKIGEIKLGGGPVIARGPNINPRVFDLLVEIARKAKIPYQVEGIPYGTGTDANVIQLTRAGVATGLVSIPNRYMHSPVELVHEKDLENIARLLAAFAARLTPKTDFTPF